MGRLRGSIRTPTSLCVALVLILCVAGCGSGSHNVGDTPAPIIPGPNAAVVKNGVIVLNPDVVQVVEAADDFIRLSGDVPSLKPGNIIVSGEGEGLLRKVENVVNTGGQCKVVTTSAALTDVFQYLSMNEVRPLNYSDFASFEELADGVSINKV